MNEWPTLVRTGTPPCSRITSGTAREQIRLCRIVAPGFVRSTAAARIAVVVEPDSPTPVSSTTNTRSASPSNASPTSKPPATHPGPQVALVGRLQRVGGVVGERAVELAVHHLELDRRQALEHRRHDEAAHAVGGVGDDPQRAQRRPGRRTTATWSTNVGEQVALACARRPAAAGAGPCPSSTVAGDVALISPSPCRCRPAGRRRGTA